MQLVSNSRSSALVDGRAVDLYTICQKGVTHEDVLQLIEFLYTGLPEGRAKFMESVDKLGLFQVVF